MVNGRGRPLCNYCGIPSHQRAVCRHRPRDVENGIKRNSHLARGTMSSNNQARREAQAKLVAATDQWNNRAPTPPPQAPQNQIAQWNGYDNAPFPMTVVVTNPEDQCWLPQATSSGCDPKSVITACRQRQQQHSRTQSPMPQSNTIPQNTPKVSSLLPSGMVACNECGHVSATFEQLEDRYNAVHTPRQLALTNGSDRQI